MAHRGLSPPGPVLDPRYRAERFPLRAAARSFASTEGFTGTGFVGPQQSLQLVTKRLPRFKSPGMRGHRIFAGRQMRQRTTLPAGSRGMPYMQQRSLGFGAVVGGLQSAQALTVVEPMLRNAASFGHGC